MPTEVYPGEETEVQDKLQNLALSRDSLSLQASLKFWILCKQDLYGNKNLGCSLKWTSKYSAPEDSWFGKFACTTQIKAQCRGRAELVLSKQRSKQ